MTKGEKKVEPIIKTVSGMDKYLNPADRGYIYEFLESDGTCNDKYCLVVSSQKRAYDNIISILMLGDSRAGLDVVKCNFQGLTKYVHCGLVTYLKRERLGKRVCPFPKKSMDTVDLLMANELGLDREKELIYKSLYEEILRTFMKGGEHT